MLKEAFREMLRRLSYHLPPDLPDEVKADIIRTFVKKIEVYPDKLSITFKIPDRSGRTKVFTKEFPYPNAFCQDEDLSPR